MAVVKKLGMILNLNGQKDLLWGRVNDIFVNIRFIRHIKNQTNASLVEALIQPKYDRLSMDFFVSRKEGINLREVSDFLEDQYDVFKTGKVIYNKGRFCFSLFPRTIAIKTEHVIKFVTEFTDFLELHGYSSGCVMCGSNDNLSQVDSAGMMTEICENCCLKKAVL